MESDVYYGVEGGGQAYRQNGQFYWLNPPKGFQKDAPIPPDWCLTGPFDIQTNEPVD